MLIGCDTCPIRGTDRAASQCPSCVVPAFAGMPRMRAYADVLPPGDAGLPLDARERAAVTALVGAGLISPETAGAARARPESGPFRRAAG